MNIRGSTLDYYGGKATSMARQPVVSASPRHQRFAVTARLAVQYRREGNEEL